MKKLLLLLLLLLTGCTASIPGMNPISYDDASDDGVTSVREMIFEGGYRVTHVIEELEGIWSGPPYKKEIARWNRLNDLGYRMEGVGGAMVLFVKKKDPWVTYNVIYTRVFIKNHPDNLILLLGTVANGDIEITKDGKIQGTRYILNGKKDGNPMTINIPGKTFIIEGDNNIISRGTLK